MTRFSATTLDLSRLPVPAVIKDIDKDKILAERLASLKVRFEAAGIPWDVDKLESDPGVILQQEDTYREVLDKAAINDAAKSVLVPYATGSDLDVLALRFGVERLTGEDDARLRSRVQLAPDAYSSAGALGAYRYHALSVSIQVKDVGIYSPMPGVVVVAVLSTEGDGTAADDLVAAVRAVLMRDDIRPLTDALTVKAARILTYGVEFNLLIPDGPDPAIVRAAAQTAIETIVGERHRVGATVHLSALIAAAHVSNVLDVQATSPATDIEVDSDQAAFCSQITLTSQVAQ